jgi:putative flippase GtrA
MDYLFVKFIRFCFVGALGLVIDFGTTYTCKEKFNWQKYFANSFGFGLAVCCNYVLNRYWTFASFNEQVLKEFSLYILVALVGLFINNTIIWISHTRLEVRFYYAKIIAISITVLWNFFSNYFITFSSAINEQ